MTDFLFSPFDTRYRKDLPQSLSESELIRLQAEVEVEWLLTLMREGLCPRVPEKKLREICLGVTAEEIEEIEARTRHATRALVEAIAARLTKAGYEKAADWVHVGLTSFDTVDTAARLRVKRYFEADGLQAIADLKAQLYRWAEKHKATPQVGRTHGQWAVPTFFGLQFAEALERISVLEERLEASIDLLRGQASGAIGGYHATSLLAKNPLHLEERFLTGLGLKPHYGLIQILPPEDILSVAQDFASIASVAAKVAGDLRHLARSEIGEVAEGFAPGQVGSSTMPQKRNPWNLEHVCSLHKVLLSRLHLLELDLVTEHQRDLTNSASGRFHAEVFMVAHLMLRRLTKILERLEAQPGNMKNHLKSAGSSVLAEALYILGTREGVSHAHDVVREAAREAERSGKTLFEVISRQGWLPKGLSLKKLEEECLKGSRLKVEAVLKSRKGGTRVRRRRT